MIDQEFHPCYMQKEYKKQTEREWAIHKRIEIDKP